MIVLGRDLQTFLNDLEVVATSPASTAELVGGWGDTVYARLTFTSDLGMDPISVQVSLSDDDRPADFRFEGSFVSQPEAIGITRDRVQFALDFEREGDFDFDVCGGPDA